MKVLATDLNPFQIAWFRFSGMAILLFPVLLFKYGRDIRSVNRPWIQIFRGLSMAGGTTAFVVGAQTVDYADAIAILYAYPFLLILAAVAFLGEKANTTVWLGVIGGFIGVLMVMRPGFDEVNSGTLFILLCAVVVTAQLALNRKLSASSPPLITAFWGALVASVGLSISLPFVWQSVPSDIWWAVIALIFSGAINQTMLVIAFAKADASTLAPFSYSEMLAAVILGYLFFDTLPTWMSWLGIALISVSGLFVARSLGKTIPRRVTRI